MFDKLLALLERFVVAVEAIAAAGGTLQAPANAPADGPKPSRSRAAKDKEDKAPTPPATDTSFDFLGGSATNPAKKYERSDVKAALEKLVAKVGQPAAFALFNKEGGVQSLQDLPEDKFAAVIEAAEKELAKK